MRGAQEHHRDRRGRGRRPRLRRQRQGRAHDPRPRRDDPASASPPGANPLTFAGLAGIGDVIATCGSKLSRNHRLGEELAKGRAWADIEASLPGVAEGAYTVDAALALAARLGVEMPIAQEVHNALFEGKSVQRCLIDLLSRESKDELADFQRWIERLGVPG